MSKETEIKQDTDPFTVDLVGDLTGELFKGTFRAKKFLSYQDYINADRAYRDLLGGQNPDHAQDHAKEFADTISQLSVRLTEWPRWWLEVDGGLKIRDANVVREIFEKAVAVQRTALEASKKRAEEAKKDLGQPESK